MPAFVGYTEKALDADGNDLTGVPTRITSLLEYEELYGGPVEEELEVVLEQSLGADGKVTDTSVALSQGSEISPRFMLHYSMRLYFANGGGPCFVISVGTHGKRGTGSVSRGDLSTGIEALASVDEVTLLVFPDSVQLSDQEHGAVINTALKHCTELKDRFAIVDVRNAISGGTDDNTSIDNNFRDQLGTDNGDELKYGAAYFPYVRTLIPIHTAEDKVTIREHSVTDSSGISSDGAVKGRRLADPHVRDAEPLIHHEIKSFLSRAHVTLPPSGAVAGVYARVDRERGVWKAPANTALVAVVEPAIRITDDLNSCLNSAAGSGKSVNAIREFIGVGTLIWGARTLASNDDESRYVPVRRFLNFIEESVAKAIRTSVIEPDDVDAWARTKVMIEDFLLKQWRQGALFGVDPGEAFYVRVGLGETMSAQDLLDGRIIVEVGLATVRPAEFIVLRFIQTIPQS